MAGKTEKSVGIRPLGDKVLLKRVDALDRSKGGIVILGGGRRLENGSLVAFQVKKGDRVLFSSYAGSPVKLEGEEYVIMGEDDILAILE